MKTKLTITLPLLDNDGLSLHKEVKTIKEKLLDMAGGMSEHRSRGAWKSENGKVYRDTSDVVSTIIEPELALAILQHYTPTWCTLLRQECLLVERVNVEVSFVEPVESSVATIA